MQKIPLKLAVPGMKLAKPVMNDRGMILCGPGTELTEQTIARLSEMDVKRIAVEGRPIDTGREEKSLSRQLEDLDVHFRRVDGDPLMKKIKNAFGDALKERAEQESAEQESAEQESVEQEKSEQA